jgi:hypothetical protein
MEEADKALLDALTGAIVYGQTPDETLRRLIVLVLTVCDITEISPTEVTNMLMSASGNVISENISETPH